MCQTPQQTAEMTTSHCFTMTPSLTSPSPNFPQCEFPAEKDTDTEHRGWQSDRSIPQLTFRLGFLANSFIHSFTVYRGGQGHGHHTDGWMDIKKYLAGAWHPILAAGSRSLCCGKRWARAEWSRLKQRIWRAVMQDQWLDKMGDDESARIPRFHRHFVCALGCIWDLDLLHQGSLL